MAEAVVSCVVKRLGDFIIQDGKFLHGVSDQVEHARTELQFMKGFLKDADARQRDDERVRICVAKIRDAAYDLEDVVEIYAFKVASKRKGSIMKVLKRFVFSKGGFTHLECLKLICIEEVEDLKVEVWNKGPCLVSAVCTYNIARD